MEINDYRTPEGKEKSREGAKKHMASILADPEKWEARKKAMLEGRKRTFAELKRLREQRKADSII